LSLTEAMTGQSIAVRARYVDAYGTTETIEQTLGIVRSSNPDATNELTGKIYHWRPDSTLKSQALLTDVEVQLAPFDHTGAPSSTGIRTGASGSAGAYACTDLLEGDYRLSGSKLLTSRETGNVINAADALAALKLSVGLNPNTDPDGMGPLPTPPVSPYQYIAADVNGDGRVTAADALSILKMAVKRIDAPGREWLFVAEGYDFWTEDPGAGKTPGFSTSRTAVVWDRDIDVKLTQDSVLYSPRAGTSAAASVTDVHTGNLVAVLKGDVNGSWAAPLEASLLEYSHFQSLAAQYPTTVNLAQFFLA
jgi:hypothetical protein